MVRLRTCNWPATVIDQEKVVDNGVKVGFGSCLRKKRRKGSQGGVSEDKEQVIRTLSV